MDEFVNETRQRIGREFTQDEEKEIKRQRRLIKNRESAFASRQRKKAEIDELVIQKDQLMQQMDELRAKDERIRELEKENQLLRAEVHSLRAIVAEQPAGFGQTFASLSDYASSVSHSVKRVLSVGDSRNGQQVKIKSEQFGGVYMLIFLFSFALFFATPFSRPLDVPVKFPSDTVFVFNQNAPVIADEKRTAFPSPLALDGTSAIMRKTFGLQPDDRPVEILQVQNRSTDSHLIDTHSTSNNLTSPLQSFTVSPLVHSIYTFDEKRRFPAN